MTSAWTGEMTANCERARPCEPFADEAARFSGLPLIEIDRCRPIEVRDLTRMVKDVAQQER
ncbi:MAG: hypothetical protein JO004_10350 [Methylobacteriaceae bacterium]|nr:hypothetical protein [Methylobacteriaceae bacterium]